MRRLIISMSILLLGTAGLMSRAAGTESQAGEQTEPKIDYVAKINELARAGRDESLNAAPFYQKAIELCVEQPKELKKLDKCSWPADLSAKQQLQLKEWVQSNSKALSQLELGRKKPYYWEKRFSRDGTVMGMLVPRLSEFRQLAFAITWRAKLAAAEGSVDKSVADVVTCYLFGLHQMEFNSYKTLIEQLVGTAVRALAMQTAFDILDRTRPDKDLLKTLQSQIEQLSTNESYILDMQSEKFCILDVIQRIFTDDGKGDGRMESEFAKEWQSMLGIKNEEQMQSLRGLSRRQTTETLEKLYEYYDFVVRKTPWQWKNEKIDPEKEIERITDRNILIKTFAPATVRIAEIFARCRAETDGLITMLALLRYKADKGQFPGKLNELVPAGYLKVLPTDPFSNKAFVYKRIGDDFMLYSFGLDCDDDGGQVGRDRKGKVKKWTKAGDALFWPVEKVN